MGPRSDLQRLREFKAESATLSESRAQKDQLLELPTSFPCLSSWNLYVIVTSVGKKAEMFFPIYLWLNIFLSYIQYKHFLLAKGQILYLLFFDTLELLLILCSTVPNRKVISTQVNKNHTQNTTVLASAAALP